MKSDEKLINIIEKFIQAIDSYGANLESLNIDGHKYVIKPSSLVWD